MKNGPKKAIVVTLVGILVVFGTFRLITFVTANIFFNRRAYSQRPVECAAAWLIPYLEKNFDINFPEGARDIKAAISDTYYRTYLVKFTAGPEDVNKFFESVGASVLHGLKQEYRRKFHYSSSINKYAPDWFKQPIKKGFITWIDISATIFVDTSDANNLTIYIKGLCGPE